MSELRVVYAGRHPCQGRPDRVVLVRLGFSGLSRCARACHGAGDERQAACPRSRAPWLLPPPPPPSPAPCAPPLLSSALGPARGASPAAERERARAIRCCDRRRGRVSRSPVASAHARPAVSTGTTTARRARPVGGTRRPVAFGAGPGLMHMPDVHLDLCNKTGGPGFDPR